MLCPSCGANLRVQPDEPLATCSHCELAVMIEWPGADRGRHAPAVFRVTDPSSPIATCPHCDGQVLRSADQAGEEIACSLCGETARMPAAVEFRTLQCTRHDYVYLSHLGCPECARERRLVD